MGQYEDIINFIFDKRDKTMAKLICLNVGCADTSIIQVDYEIIMVDCYDGLTFQPYLPINKNIKALFITHQHRDHFQGMKYLIENNYSVEYLIYSPYQRRYNDNSVEYDEWQEFLAYKEIFEKKGTKIYAPYRQDNFDKPWWEVLGMKIWLIGPEKNIAKSDTREIHDASLVIHTKLNSRRCLFAGDASDKSLKYVADNTTNICNDVLHASHHGSINGADLGFIKKANAKHTVISTKTGVHDSIPHPTALQRYQAHTMYEVYRTDKSGTLTFDFN